MENRRNSKTIKSYNSVYGEFQARDMPIRQFAAKVPYPNCLPLLIEKYVESINFIQMWLCWMNQQVISPTSYLVSLQTHKEWTIDEFRCTAQFAMNLMIIYFLENDHLIEHMFMCWVSLCLWCTWKSFLYTN